MNGIFLSSAEVPESLTLLVLGVCLIGVTFTMRRLLKRYDEGEQQKAENK